MSEGEGAIGAVLLAAGASARMGQAKPLLEYQGETFLDRQIALYGRVCRPVVVVLGYRASEIAAGLQRGEQALLVLNARPECGQSSSLACGVRALPAQVEAFLFTPVDSPGVMSQTLDALLAAWRGAARKPALVVPVYAGRRGHPVLVSAALASEFLAANEARTARDIVHAHLGEALAVAVEDETILRDIDDPAAYAALIGEARPCE